MEYFLAFYIAGVLFSLYRLYYPSVNFLKKFHKESILVRLEITGWIVAIVLFTLAFPALILPTLIDKWQERFVLAFCDEALKR